MWRPVRRVSRRRQQTETAGLHTLSRLSADASCAALASSASGLETGTAQLLLSQYGANVIAREERPGMPRLLWNGMRNPLNALLVALAGASFSLGDARAASVIVVMVMLSIITAFIQEYRSTEAAAACARLSGIVPACAGVRPTGRKPSSMSR